MTAPARRRPADGEEVETFARTLIGLPQATAIRRAHKAGCTVRDLSEDDWFTQALVRRRINLVVRDGIVVEASVG